MDPSRESHCIRLFAHKSRTHPRGRISINFGVVRCRLESPRLPVDRGEKRKRKGERRSGGRDLRVRTGLLTVDSNDLTNSYKTPHAHKNITNCFYSPPQDCNTQPSYLFTYRRTRGGLQHNFSTHFNKQEDKEEEHSKYSSQVGSKRKTASQLSTPQAQGQRKTASQLPHTPPTTPLIRRISEDEY